MYLPAVVHEGSKYEILTQASGRKLFVHPRSECKGGHCPIHRPSFHPLMSAPMLWRSDRWVPFMERICDHGVGHPDPDDLAYKRVTMDPDRYENEALDVHGCDGCCANWPAIPAD
jgi:hypothetical protein